MLQVRVIARQPEAENIDSFVLECIEGGKLPAYTPGAHIDVEAGNGFVRQYSLCGEPSSGTWRIAVLKHPASRGGSRAMHDAIQVGSQLQVSAPRNLFELSPAPHVVLVAGGIGVTPILAMAKALSSSGASFELHYCARRPGAMAFRDELGSSAYADRVHRYFNELPEGEQFDAARILRTTHPGAHLYVCGPAPFMEYVAGAAYGAGWAGDRVHQETFSPAVPQADAGSFSLKLVNSGRVIAVPKDVTALQALLDAGVDVPYSCENGVCGTCLTRVLEGEPEHHDQYLTSEEQACNDQFTPCCSRSKSPILVVDL